MEILIIQKKAFEEMAAKFSRFTERVDAILAKQGGKSLNAWMDNQEVCRQLNISPRTLQTLRDNGTLAYSQINHKVFYKPEDVMRIIGKATLFPFPFLNAGIRPGVHRSTSAPWPCAQGYFRIILIVCHNAVLFKRFLLQRWGDYFSILLFYGSTYVCVRLNIVLLDKNAPKWH